MFSRHLNRAGAVDYTLKMFLFMLLSGWDFVPFWDEATVLYICD